MKFYIRVPVVSNLLKLLRKSNKMLGNPSVLIFRPTSLKNSMEHERLCLILYIHYCTLNKFVI